MPDGDADDGGDPAREPAGDADPGNGSNGSSGAVPDDPWRKLSYETDDPSDGADPPAEGEDAPATSGTAEASDGPDASEDAAGEDGPREAGGDGADDEDEYGPEDRGSGLIGEHAHETPHPQDWPYLERGDDKGLDKHPYCEDCGLVKHVGPDRPLPGGGLVNLVARVKDRLEREGRTLTDAQKRIILQKLRDENVDDDWGLDRATQLQLFEEVVADVTGVEQSFVHGIMHDILERRGRV